MKERQSLLLFVNLDTIVSTQAQASVVAVTAVLFGLLILNNLLPISVQPIPVSSRKVITSIHSPRVVSRRRTPERGNPRTPFNLMSATVQTVVTALSGPVFIVAMWFCPDLSLSSQCSGLVVAHC